MSVPALPEPVAIARLEERRVAAGVGDIASVAEPIMGGVMCYTGPGSWCNQALGLGLDGAVTDAEIDRLVAFYVDRGQEPRVELCPFADQALIDGLGARGFVLTELGNCLARGVGADEDFRAMLAHGWPAGIEVRRIDPRDDAMALRWVRVSNSGFCEPGSEKERAFTEDGLRLARHPRVVAFGAFAGAEMVGAGGIEVWDAPTGERTACLIAASVLEAWRGRGVQQAMIAERLACARERGVGLVCIGSKPGIPTERNALRLGFSVAYTRARMVMRREGLARSM